MPGIDDFRDRSNFRPSNWLRFDGWPPFGRYARCLKSKKLARIGDERFQRNSQVAARSRSDSALYGPPLTGRLHLFNNDSRNLSFRLSVHITPPRVFFDLSSRIFLTRSEFRWMRNVLPRGDAGAVFVPTRNKCIINAAMCATSEINCLSLRKVSGIISQSELANHHLLKSNRKLFL